MNAEWLVERWWSWIVPLSCQVAVLIAMIAVVTWLARRTSPQVRYLLWCLVLIKVFLPPSLAVSWGVGHWGLKPAWESVQLAGDVTSDVEFSVQSTLAVEKGTADNSLALASRSTPLLFAVWLAGCVGLLLFTVVQYRRLLETTRHMHEVDEGPLRVMYERLVLQISTKEPPDLFVTDDIASPFLFGLLKPKIVLSQTLINELSEPELNRVLAHELNHWRRHDLWSAGCKSSRKVCCGFTRSCGGPTTGCVMSASVPATRTFFARNRRKLLITARRYCGCFRWPRDGPWFTEVWWECSNPVPISRQDWRRS